MMSNKSIQEHPHGPENVKAMLLEKMFILFTRSNPYPLSRNCFSIKFTLTSGENLSKPLLFCSKSFISNYPWLSCHCIISTCLIPILAWKSPHKNTFPFILNFATSFRTK
eukprot:TRINITY_DN13844_c0_g1_i1.p1 TRINITY_DN13844_c0_g1~~TRINITY_DN13844_c0_g1_i1.p1  ORF type:complete len:110 (+),score=3.21 TRINITY_DN13844_c0_g1_i1:114-443(+)